MQSQSDIFFQSGTATPDQVKFDENKAEQKDTLINRFLNHVKNTPDKLAVIFNDTAVTYKIFNENVNQLANELRHTYFDQFNLTTTKPVMIGVMCHDKLHALYSEFAILKLGAVFVPFSFQDPESRLKFVIEKSNVSLILTDDNSKINSNSLNYCQVQDSLGKSSQTSGLSNNEPDLISNNELAYILFTSGSTAQNPKGVLQSRSGLCQQIINYTKDLHITANDCLLNLATFTHDQAIVDCFGALLNGSTLCLYDVTNLNIPDLHAFMSKHNVSIFSSIPSMFYLIFKDLNATTFPNLRIVTIGGEETKISHAELFQKTCPIHCILLNGYGFTEISWVSSYQIDHQTDLKKLHTIPLGYATDGAEIILVKEDDENTYELCIGSDSLSPGYLADEEATKTAFFIENKKRYYRTGDIVTLGADKCIYFQGRKAWHEKISGKRVNLREVEAELHKIGFPNDTVVIAHGEKEQRRLYAFYTGPAINLNVYAKLNPILPNHMIPKKVFWIEELPKLPNSKVDRQSLLKKLDELTNCYTPIHDSDSSSLVIEKLWKNCLNLPQDFNPRFARKSFRELGGDSYLGILFIKQVNEYFQKKYNVNLALTPVIVDQYLNFTELEEFILNTFYNANKPCFNDEIWEMTLGMPNRSQRRPDNFWYLNSDATIGDNPTLYQFDFSALRIISDHVNQLYGIHIRVADTHQRMLDMIKKAINHVNGPSKIGLILLASPRVESAHLIPSVLCMDHKNQNFKLLVSDGLAGYKRGTIQNLFCKNGMIYQIRKMFPQIEIGFEFANRQYDKVSCSLDSIQYLSEALRMDILKEISITSNSEEDLKNEFNVLFENIKDHPNFSEHFDPIDTVNYKNCFLFIGPPETYKTAMINISDKIPQDRTLKNDSAARTLAQFIKEYQILIQGKIIQEDGTTADPQPVLLNTFLWKEGEKFCKELEPYNYAGLYYKKKTEMLECEVSYRYCSTPNWFYIKKEFLLGLDSLFDFKKIISSYMTMNAAFLIADSKIISDLTSIKNILCDSEPAFLSFTVVTQDDLGREKSLLDSFIRTYKNINPSGPAFFSSKTKYELNVTEITLKSLYISALEGDEKVIRVMGKMGWISGDETIDLLGGCTTSHKFSTSDPCKLFAVCLALEELKKDQNYSLQLK